MRRNNPTSILFLKFKRTHAKNYITNTSNESINTHNSVVVENISKLTKIYREEKISNRKIRFRNSISKMRSQRCKSLKIASQRTYIFKILTLAIFLSLGLCSDERIENPSWQNCEIFLAPSSLKTGGWGVYAARAFDIDEVIEIPPRFVAVPDSDPLVHDAVLKDYFYGYERWNRSTGTQETLAGIIFGNQMLYNHHVEPNIMYASIGRQARNAEDVEGLIGLTAKRRIEEGEELFSSYGLHDGGEGWFRLRGLDLKVLPTSETRKVGFVYEEDKKKYCSKLYAGYGRSSWNHRTDDSKIHHWLKMDPQRLSSQDHSSAVVKQDVSAGDLLEIAPALVVGRGKVSNTAVAALSFFWDDWDEIGKQYLTALRQNGHVQVLEKVYKPDGSFHNVDNFSSFEDVVVVPIGGFISLVDRVDREDDDVNSLIKILASGSTAGSAGILLKLVALKDMKAGDRVRVGIPRSASLYEKELLVEELKRNGQAIPEHLQDNTHSNTFDEEL